MRIKELKLIPPSKQSSTVLIEFMKEHEKGLKAIKTLAEIKEICKTNVCKQCYSKFKVDDNYCKSRKNCDCYNILQKINEVEND